MIKSFSNSSLSSKLAVLERVIHSKSSLPDMLFTGIDGLEAILANLFQPAVKNNSENHSVINP